jgi:hypothetical protein
MDKTQQELIVMWLSMIIIVIMMVVINHYIINHYLEGWINHYCLYVWTHCSDFIRW